MSRKSNLSKKRGDNIGNAVPLTREAVVSMVKQEVRAYSGPIPESSEMERYETISPGYAKELLEMAKKAQDHQIAMDIRESEIQKFFTERHLTLFGRGQIIASIWVLTAFGCGTAIAICSSPTAGSAIIGATLTAVAGAFLWGKVKQGSKDENN